MTLLKCHNQHNAYWSIHLTMYKMSASPWQECIQNVINTIVFPKIWHIPFTQTILLCPLYPQV